MKKLVQVVRDGRADNGYTVGLNLEQRLPSRQHPEAVLTRELSPDRSNFLKEGNFFYVEEVDVDIVVEHLATHNPGSQVRVFSLESEAQCPAGPIVRKKVNKDGSVLPAIV
jgi:hypothetical protein